MSVELLVFNNKVARIVTTKFDRVVDFDDIVGRVEPDDWSGDPPWADSDGWDHETRELGYRDDGGVRESRGYARCDCHGSIMVEIDDDDIVNKWGHTRHNGEAKQVWLERVAQVKRDALDQLVKWYEDGWSYWGVRVEHNGYESSMYGILGDDCIEDLVTGVRLEVVDSMERDGFIVTGKPKSPYHYNRVDRFKRKIHNQLEL